MPTPTLSPQSRTGLLTLLSFVLSAAPAFAQYPIAVESPVSSEGRAAATDGTNVYVTGTFDGTADFDPGAGTFDLTPVGNSDVFVAAYTTAGALVWAFNLGGTGTLQEEGRAILSDGTNVYVTGLFEGTADFDPDPVGTASLTSADMDAFVAAYEAATGTFRWAFALGGTSGDTGNALALSGGSLYVGGQFRNTVDFDPDPVGEANLTANGTLNAFVAAYDAATGEYQSVFALGESSFTVAQGLASDDTNVYVTGWFDGSIQLDPAGSVITATGLQEAFVGAYSVADGSYQWGFILAPSTSPSNRIATGQTVGTDGTTVYVAGTFRETIDLDPSDDYNGQSSEGGLDVFLAAYNAATGSYQWSASLGGSGEDLVRDIALGGGTVSMAGSFEETVDFSNGTLIDARPSAGGYDAYVSAYDRTTGLSLGAYTLGDTDEDEAYGVAADGTTLYATGYFEGTVAFPTAGGTTTLTSAGDTRDAFVAEVAFSAPVDTSPAGWPVTFGSKDGMDQVEGLAAAGGRVFTTGTFAGLTDFDSGPGMYVLSPMGGENAFVAAYDEADASLLWAFQLGGEDQTEGNSIATDGTNVYVTGAFNGTVDFDPGPDEFLLTSQETWDNSFVAAYDAASGAFVWAIKLAPENDITVGNPDFVDVNAITTDGTNVYLTGTFRGPADFDPGPGTTSLTGQSGDIFLAAYSAGAGAFVWVTAPSGPEYDDGRNLATDGTRVYASGGFRSTVNFDPSGSAPLTATGNQDGFVAAYDAADGSYLWAFAVGGAGVFTSNDALALSNDRLFIGGDFDGTVQFDPDEIAAPLTATNDLYVAAYTTDGAYLWAELLNSNGSQRVNALTADAFNVYATGWFDGTLDLDPGPGTANVNNIGYDDLFLGIYGADTGAYKDGYQAGSSQDDYGTTGNALAIARSSLYVGGYFSFTVDLALDDAVANRTSSGGANEDAFVTRLSVNNTPLPVELTSFEASVDGDDQVFLTWATASETNNAGFEVQTRSLDAEPQPWETLAFVEGHGTSAQAHTYEHRVHNLEPGPHRFRLKQIDFDGTFTYSPEVEVALRVPGTHRLSAPYPNPSSDRVRFALTVAHAQHVSIAVYDALGRRVAMLHDGSVEANQRLHVEWQPDALPGGLYFVRAQGDRFAETGRVVLNP